MNVLSLSSRHLLWWLAPVAALLVLAAVMIDSAQGASADMPRDAAAPKPVVPELLPEYSIGGGPEARPDTVNRTLFNPTRRPAPTPVQETPKPQMQRGQFVLTGTSVVDGKATAFLRDVKTGKSRRVTQGDNVNGLTVTEVKADHVKLTMGDESEDVSLRVIANPRSTPGAAPPPVVAGAPQAGAGAAGLPGPAPGAPGSGPQVAQTPEQAAQTLLERRRAARAAAAAGGDPTLPPTAAQPAAPAAAQQPNTATTQNASQSWADVFRHYQERSGVAPARR